MQLTFMSLAETLEHESDSAIIEDQLFWPNRGCSVFMSQPESYLDHYCWIGGGLKSQYLTSSCIWAQILAVRTVNRAC